MADGVAADEVRYWRDMQFGPHFLNLLTKREILASVRFGPSLAVGDDRKTLSRKLHQAVLTLGGV